LSLKAAETLIVKYGYAWGRPGDVLELVGILDGAEAARMRFGCDARADRLELAADASTLRVRPGDEWDAVRVVATLRDQYGNRCAHAFDPLQIEASGPGRVVGPALTSLSGGAVAFWIATTGEPGSIKVRASVPRFAATELSLEAVLDHDR
jgi:beta-galactosidase